MITELAQSLIPLMLNITIDLKNNLELLHIPHDLGGV